MIVMFEILMSMLQSFVIIYALLNLTEYIRNKKYQKLWNKEKAMRTGPNSHISNTELCQQYVMFCKRNDCKVDF